MARTGTENCNAKATPELVRDIRANVQGWPRWRWAHKAKMSTTAIDKIANYETWRHVK